MDLATATLELPLANVAIIRTPDYRVFMNVCHRIYQRGTRVPPHEPRPRSLTLLDEELVFAEIHRDPMTRLAHRLELKKSFQLAKSVGRGARGVTRDTDITCPLVCAPRAPRLPAGPAPRPRVDV
ncbi:hypothetical protein EVAR_99086_1 [Eumeta japonica]|uniref:Uncharacterized protein n=1 Tax=Eumeta variegata TaxID=151549 RepID=A0A4C1ZLI5_EUMVA|nr:hypothetical protein EVAR_99086_1 [Eumeta japonica]